MGDPVVAFDGLTVWYGEHEALRELTLEIPRGSVYALLGRNGAGKTSAIECLLGLRRPTRGRALLLGCDSRRLTPAVRARVGFVAEDDALVPWMRVGRLRDFQAATMPSFDPRSFDEHVGRLGLKLRSRVKTLSRGQRAQVALALALAADPEVAVLDDPAIGLDTVVRREFLEAMIDLVQRAGRTVLFTSHVLADVERVADRVAILDRGVLRVRGPMDEVRERVVRVHVRFGVDPPSSCPVESVFRIRRRDPVWTLTAADGGAAVAAWARSRGATFVEVERLGLEELFVEVTSRPAAGDRASVGRGLDAPEFVGGVA